MVRNWNFAGEAPAPHMRRRRSRVSPTVAKNAPVRMGHPAQDDSRSLGQISGLFSEAVRLGDSTKVGFMVDELPSGGQGLTVDLQHCNFLDFIFDDFERGGCAEALGVFKQR